MRSAVPVAFVAVVLAATGVFGALVAIPSPVPGSTQAGPTGASSLHLVSAPAGHTDAVRTANGTITVTANDGPGSGSVTLRVNLWANATGGAPPYTWTWRFGDGTTSIGQQNTTQYFSKPGTYVPWVWVNDSAGGSGSASASPITVTPNTAVTVTGNDWPRSGAAPLLVHFSANASGGTPPYSWAWGTDSGCHASQAYFNCTFTAQGTYRVFVWANDSGGGSGSDSLPTINVAQGLAVSTAASPSSTTVGTAIQFTATASGGQPTYSYSWRFGDGSTGTGASTSHAYAIAGAFTATAFVNDSGGHFATSSVPVTVQPVSPAVSVSASPNPAYIGQQVNFTSQVSGGSPPYTYAWAFGDGGTGGDLAAISHIFTTNGPFMTDLMVTDTAGGVGHAYLNISIALQASITGNTSSGSIPLVVGFSSDVSGGVPAYAYSWVFGDGARSNSPNPSHVFTATGTFVSRLFVNDSAGHSVQAAWTVTALKQGSPGSPATGTGFLGLPGEDGVYLVAALAAIAGAVAARYVIPPRTDRVGSEPKDDSYRDFKDAVGSRASEPVDTLKQGETDPASDIY